MKRINFFFKSPLSCFHGNCGKVCPTVSDFFSLSRFTRYGCCTYQVSSISVRRVTCYDHFYEFDERNKKKLKSPLFYFHCNCAKFVLLIPICLAYLVPLDVVVTGNITANICEVWSEFNIFCTLVTMATAAILNLFNPQRCHTLR